MNKYLSYYFSFETEEVNLNFTILSRIYKIYRLYTGLHKKSGIFPAIDENC